MTPGSNITKFIIIDHSDTRGVVNLLGKLIQNFTKSGAKHLLLDGVCCNFQECRRKKVMYIICVV